MAGSILCRQCQANPRSRTGTVRVYQGRLPEQMPMGGPLHTPMIAAECGRTEQEEGAMASGQTHTHAGRTVTCSVMRGRRLLIVRHLCQSEVRCLCHVTLQGQSCSSPM
ncbi:hypothetical protein NDU88_006413 [Pleurodeles waltl]|uniref:Uncharacterized protein n=1 Tax=Pleurodeles waltl TaxID=8319 RepID=A0AAV7N174_PLEWA|nr:hypothetical protein NDU88_006413 [Pleurodeles waltl]